MSEDNKIKTFNQDTFAARTFGTVFVRQSGSFLGLSIGSSSASAQWAAELRSSASAIAIAIASSGFSLGMVASGSAAGSSSASSGFEASAPSSLEASGSAHGSSFASSRLRLRGLRGGPSIRVDGSGPELEKKKKKPLGTAFVYTELFGIPEIAAFSLEMQPIAVSVDIAVEAVPDIAVEATVRQRRLPWLIEASITKAA